MARRKVYRYYDMSTSAISAGLTCIFFLVAIAFLASPKDPQTNLSPQKNPTDILAIMSWYTFLNLVFVKAGWAVSSILIVAWILCGIKGEIKKSWRRGLDARMYIWIGANIYWFLCTRAFSLISSRFGTCRVEASTGTLAATQAISKIVSITISGMSFEDCRAKHGNWSGFDISGHCFLIVHAVLLLVEEWRVATNASKDLLGTTLPLTSSDDAMDGSSESINPRVSNVLRHLRSLDSWHILSLVTVCIIFAWSLLFISTILSHHTPVEKLLGNIIGALYWLATAIALRLYSNKI